MIVEGQVHGGIAQGIGQAHARRPPTTTTGQLLSGSLHGLLHAARGRPAVLRGGLHLTPCPSNPLGIKGCGEAGAIASPPPSSTRSPTRSASRNSTCPPHHSACGFARQQRSLSADYPAAVLALGGSVKTTSRTIAADDYFKGMFETALEEGEIITEISFPVPEKAAYMKFPNPASRYAMVGVFVAKLASGVRVAVTGAASSVFREKAMEAALSKSFTPDAVASIKVSPSNLNSDLHATAEYRAHLVTVMAKRAVAAALA
jgi:hypothetical protein